MELFKGFPTKSDKPPLKVGIVGLGVMGRLRERYIREDPRFKLVAVCDTDGEKIKKYKDVACYCDYNELIKDNIDIVYACTVNGVLPDVVIAAIKAGRHVFCEKPPGKTEEDVKKIINTNYNQNEIVVQYGFNHRYHYSVMKAKELIDSKDLGEVLWIRGVYGKSGGKDFKNAWRNYKKNSGGGILIDQGIHLLDLVQYFGIDYKIIYSSIETSYWNIEVEDNAFIMINDDGKNAILHSSATQWEHCFRVEIGLTGGLIKLDGLITGSQSYGREQITWLKNEQEYRAPIFGQPIKHTCEFNKDDSWKIEQNIFLEKIYHKDYTIKESKEALNVMRAICRVYEKSKD